MRKSMTVAIAILAVASLVLVAGCGGKGTGEPKAKKGGVLVFARSGDAVGLDPAREDDGESFYIADNVYETLVEFKPGTTDIIPGLAESWTASADALEYTFKLRKGVKFHDGTAFNAEAVVYSLSRQFKKDHPEYGNGPWKYWGYMDMDNIIQDVAAVDNLTVKISLKKPEAPFIANLAMNFSAIVSPTAAKKYGKDFSSNPVGTGAFKFVSWVKDDNIVLERYTGYWGKKAYLDRVIVKVIPDATARYLALKKGEVDLIDFPNPSDISAIEADTNLKVVKQAGMNVGYLALNTQKKPFTDKRVRQALNYAVNKAEILEAVYGPLGVSAKNPLPPDMWGYNKAIEEYGYDPAKAKQLLAEAGYPNGFKTTLWAMPVSRPYNPNGRRMAEILQAQFKAVGITAEIVSYEWGTYLDKTDHGEHDMCLLGWTGDNGDPDNFLWVLLSAPAAEVPAGNVAFWKNDEFTALIKQAKETADQAKRTQLYEQAQVIFHEEAPWVTMAHSVVVEPMKKTVEGFVLYPTGKRYFAPVWLNQ
ncbi:MAG: ABC transporter substrate-binding protein [Spirochaetes bacterium]|nr:ABC transporter substrate-binding protein [Spirochaetota bacterium]